MIYFLTRLSKTVVLNNGRKRKKKNLGATTFSTQLCLTSSDNKGFSRATCLEMKI